MAIPALARLAAAVLTNEDGRRTAGKVLALILSPLIILAAFLCCFGDGAPTRAAADRFVDCFYKTETRTRVVTVTQEDGTEELVEETYEVAVPLPVEEVYE